jgi:hypothetical protein
MVIAQHPSLLIGTGYSERPASPELQEQLDKADAALPPELRERFPVVARDEIKRRYPDHWIALLPTHVDERDSLIAGRLVACAKEWQEFSALIEPIKLAHPRLPLFTDYTGRYPMGENVVRV